MGEGKFANVRHNEKCFINCISEKFGFMNKGEIQPNVIQQKMGSSVGAKKLKALQAKCDSKKGSDKCETAFNVYRCYYNNN